MRRTAVVVTALVVIALAYFAAWPIDVDPVSWRPLPDPGFTGPYTRNDALAGADLIDVDGEGPEDVAVAADGALYAGLEDGRIVRVTALGGAPATFAHTGGRPLGLRFAPDGRLIVADAVRGLLAVDASGSVRVLANAHDGIPFRFADDLDVASDGTVYFTDATTRFGVSESIPDIVEHRSTGRLLAYDPRAGSTRVLLSGLAFANGVALAPDASFALVVETASYGVRKLWLRGPRAGTTETVLDGLPAFPDGILGDGHGTYWIALASPRNRLLDALHPRPFLKKALLRVPRPLQPGPTRHGFVLAIDGDGRVRHNLQDPHGRVALVTNAVPHGAWLYLGMLSGRAVGRIRRPR